MKILRICAYAGCIVWRFSATSLYFICFINRIKSYTNLIVLLINIEKKKKKRKNLIWFDTDKDVLKNTKSY